MMAFRSNDLSPNVEGFGVMEYSIIRTYCESTTPLAGPAAGCSLQSAGCCLPPDLQRSLSLFAWGRAARVT